MRGTPEERGPSFEEDGKVMRHTACSMGRARVETVNQYSAGRHGTDSSLVH